MLFGFYIYPPEISITNAYEFNNIVHNASYVDIKLENDIDMVEIDWSPTDFYGNLKGEGYRIYNLSFRGGNTYALFEELGGEVQDLTIEVIEGNFENVSQFAGVALNNNGKIDNCQVSLSANIVSTAENATVGGLVASNGVGEITNSSVSGYINLTSNGNVTFGGLVGETRSDSFISENVVALNFNFTFDSGSLEFGGLVGDNLSTITCSKAEINLNLNGTLSEAVIGGLVGRTRTSINNSYVTGTMNLNYVNATTGGLVGEFSRRREVVEHCYQNLDIQNISGVTGALIGNLREGEVRSCFAVSNLTNLLGSNEFNEGIAPNPQNCQIFESVDDVTNSFGFSEEFWNLSGNLPTLICFEN